MSQGRRLAGFRASTRRTHPLYPDAATLRPDVDPSAVIAAVDPAEGCSIKDSFACLDPGAAGFEPIIDATWIARPAALPSPAPPVGWSVVDTAGGLAEWVRAWGGPPGVFRPELLSSPEVRILVARRAGEVVAGAAANRTGSVVGVSNLFAVDGDLDAAWAGVLSVLPAGRQVVGYETGPALAAATNVGFACLGPLRVWRRHERPA